MPSSPEPVASGNPSPVVYASRAWNRRLHYYLGLYFLFFVWLFALTGLLLNHGSWKFAEFWPGRKVATSEHPIQPPAAGNTLAGAQDLMRQLGIAGEIQCSTPGRIRRASSSGRAGPGGNSRFRQT